MAIELILEGTLEKESDREGFVEIIKEVCEEHKIKIEDYDTMQVMDICPEGYIECNFEGLFISITSETNVAGAGYHAFVAQVYDDIIEKSGIVLAVSDPTQYYENRDFETLKYKYFYPWLANIRDYAIEESTKGTDLFMCWDMATYRPKAKVGQVVTPMGYIRIEDFQQEELEVMAERFFIWNHQERDAMYYRNCAYALLWKECYFKYSTMNEYTSKIAHMIIDYAEAAYDADNTMELPYDAYSLLCETLKREALIHHVETAKHKEIGYRNHVVQYPLGNWFVACDGFAEKTFDTVTKSLNIMAPYKDASMPWSWLLKGEIVKGVEESVYATPCLEAASTFDIYANDLVGKGYLIEDEEFTAVIAHFHKNDEMLILQCFVNDQKEIDQIKNWYEHVTYIKIMQTSDTLH